MKTVSRRNATITLIASWSLVALAPPPAHADGDPKRGASLFEDNCSECHAAKADGGNRKGPNLFGVVSRKSGSVPGFDYSDANLALNWLWTPARLDPYLASPQKIVPGTIMKFKGDPDPQERADIIAYLVTLHN